jgi:hypothetical protein
LVITALKALEEPTGCGGIVGWGAIGNVGDLQGIINITIAYLRHKVPNEKETEDIIIKKGEILYEELGELGRRESSVREIPLESYVYAYMKLIHS